MESWDKGASVVDCVVGTIVWVRRRNGSWWPGKILSPEELSAANLMSPRSGTPVKLLGREDASVDWYNLEKSKRVKAFRCGEFDDCIERAESSQGVTPKKREKYARREDAILHALELEKQLKEEKFGKLCFSSNGRSSKSFDAVKKVPVTDLHDPGYDNDKLVRPKSNSKKLDLSLEDKSMGRPIYAQKVQDGNQMAGDEDNSEVIHRMRDLQDFGLRITPSQRKLSSSVASSGSHEPESDDNAHTIPSSRLSTEKTVHANNKNSLDKKRKSHEVLTDEALVRRRDRCRPLVQVLQSSAKFPVHHSLQHDNCAVPIHMSGEEQIEVIAQMERSSSVNLPGESSECSDDKKICTNQKAISPSHFEVSTCPHPVTLLEENTSESTESTETDSLESDTEEEMVELSDAVAVTELEPKSLGRSGPRVQHRSVSSEEPDDVALAGDMSHFYPHDPDSASIGVSKWQLKGKRNNRGLTKRFTDVNERKVSIGSIYGTNLEERESNSCDEPELIGMNFRTQRRAFDNQGYLVNSKSKSKGLDDITHSIIDWEDSAWNDRPVLKGYGDDSSNYFDPVFVGRHTFGSRMRSMLVEVDLKVQSSYQRAHVPMISLMSKLNGQAIVGHPIQIETLENGSSEILLSAADGIYQETLDNDTELSPVWRTARRTANFRVPRSHPSSSLNGDETAGHFQCVEQEKKKPFKKFSVGRKSISHASRPSRDRKFSRKPSKKKSLSSTQKIKTLSSIGTEQKRSNDSKLGYSNYQMDGLIKGESGPTAVSCIPVKLVFSRLYEELVGRHQ